MNSSILYLQVKTNTSYLLHGILFQQKLTYFTPNFLLSRLFSLFLYQVGPMITA